MLPIPQEIYALSPTPWFHLIADGAPCTQMMVLSGPNYKTFGDILDGSAKLDEPWLKSVLDSCPDPRAVFTIGPHPTRARPIEGVGVIVRAGPSSPERIAELAAAFDRTHLYMTHEFTGTSQEEHARARLIGEFLGNGNVGCVSRMLRSMGVAYEAHVTYDPALPRSRVVCRWRVSGIHRVEEVADVCRQIVAEAAQAVATLSTSTSNGDWDTLVNETIAQIMVDADDAWGLMSQWRYGLLAAGRVTILSDIARRLRAGKTGLRSFSTSLKLRPLPLQSSLPSSNLATMSG